MNCHECREHFTTLWEEERSSEEIATAREHLKLCVDCQSRYTEFERAQRLLRASTPVAAPKDLAKSILGALESEASRTPPAIEFRRRRRRRVAAAALLFTGIAGGFGARSVIDSAGTDALLEEARTQSADASAALEVERARHRRELEVVNGSLAESRRQHKASITQLRTQREEATTALEQAARQTALAADSAKACATHRRELEARVALLETQLAAAQAASRQRRRAPPPAQDLTKADRTNTVGAPPKDTPRVVVRRRAGHYEAEVRGPRHEVIPELLALARDRGERQVSTVALGTLENLLGSELAEIQRAESRLHRERNGEENSSWLARWRASVGWAPAPKVNASPSGRNDYERRLRDVERAWSSLSSGVVEAELSEQKAVES